MDVSAHNVTTVFLLGFPGLHSFSILCFSFILIIYLLTICGNLLVLTLVSYNENLHCPMYFLLTQLTISDIIIISDVVPNMLPMVLNNGTSMSLLGCLTQLFFFGSSEASECLLLTVMSYDRYLAICHPLHYDSIMSPRLCLKYISMCWFLGFTVTLVQTVNVSQLRFCLSDIIDHFFCDFDPVLKLSCSDIQTIKLVSIFLGFPIIVCPFVLVVFSYIYIVHTILRIQSITGRQKAFSTCSSHLTVVSIFYGTLFSIYLIPKHSNAVLHKTLSPLLNPIIYCLKNEKNQGSSQKDTGVSVLSFQLNISQK